MFLLISSCIFEMEGTSMKTLSNSVSKIDPAVFVWHDLIGILPVYVGDILWVGY